MALSLDPATRIISIPQGDLTPVSGTLYDVDTDAIRNAVMALLDDEEFIWMPDAFNHNTEVTVAGTTYARLIEYINSFQIQFTPDSQWTARLIGSNNNMFDVEGGVLVQNQVQVIPTNSAGLQTVASGSGLSSEQSTQLLEVYRLLGLDSGNPVTTTTSDITAADIDIDITGDGETSTTLSRQ